MLAATRPDLAKAPRHEPSPRLPPPHPPPLPARPWPRRGSGVGEDRTSVLASRYPPPPPPPRSLRNALWNDVMSNGTGAALWCKAQVRRATRRRSKAPVRHAHVRRGRRQPRTAWPTCRLLSVLPSIPARLSGQTEKHTHTHTHTCTHTARARLETKNINHDREWSETTESEPADASSARLGCCATSTLLSPKCMPCSRDSCMSDCWRKSQMRR